MELIDIGANLTHVSFEHDFDAVVADAKHAEIAHIILTGTDAETSIAAQAMAAADNGFFSSTAGFHPHVADSCGNAELELIADLATRQEVVAIGETGLDFNRNYSSSGNQQTVFEQHLELAAASQKPVFLHQRDAHDPFLATLKQYRERISGGVVHCFTDTEKALQDYLNLDMHIGITGWICDERRGLDLREHVRLIPANRLLIETDAPYLLPRSIRPKPKSRRNEPKHLQEVLKIVAECRQETVEEVAKATAENARRLFRLGV